MPGANRLAARRVAPNVGRAIRHAVVLALVAAAAYVAVPALSATPYIPGAVDFEQPLPAVKLVRAAGEHAEPGYRSPVIVAPDRFDLVGIAGEMREVEIRAREEGGEWSDWIHSANGDPAYFGGAEELQVRTEGWRPAGTLHYVNVSGTTSEVGSVLTAARRWINGAFISATEVIDPTAQAAPAEPEIVSRREWGASLKKGGCPPREEPVYGRVKAAAVHHTVTAGTYTQAEAPSIVLGICRYHRNANGWNDIGYNALVDKYGTIYAGRAGGLPNSVIGAHAQGFNTYTTGVAVIGTHTKVPVTPETKEGLVSWLAWKLNNHGLHARGKTWLRSAGGSASRYPAGRRVVKRRIIGHRQLNFTTCPGDGLFRGLREIRALTEERIAGTPPPAPAPPPPAPPPSDGGVIPAP
jgi:hypothetical protein